MKNKEASKQKFVTIITAYPFVLLIIAIIANLFVFGVRPIDVALPSIKYISALTISAVLLVINHTWLMTSTELTRLKYGIKSTPEEWDASENQPENISKEGMREFMRRQNAHRNATENTVHFVLLAFIISFVSPTPLAEQIWIFGFAIGRLGHTFSYLHGWDGARGLFMSLNLIAMYGLASYLAISIFV